MYDEERTDSRGRFRYCCYTDEVESCTTTGGSSGAAEWKIQNSWATGWGESGFMRLEVSGGYGVSGINRVVEYVTAQ